MSNKSNGLFVDWRWVVLLLVVVLILSNAYWVWKQKEQYRVVRVIDGDTFVIKSGERVRLTGLDAPEVGQCGSEQATELLKSLVINKIIRIDSDDRDIWGRRLGVITIGDMNVNKEMVNSGWARYDSFSDNKILELEKAGMKAEREKLGIYSGVCDKKQTCGILGNIDESNGKKYYHLPGCISYSKVVITPERNEKVFCTENEAIKAGFSLAPDCVR